MCGDALRRFFIGRKLQVVGVPVSLDLLRLDRRVRQPDFTPHRRGLDRITETIAIPLPGGDEALDAAPLRGPEQEGREHEVPPCGTFQSDECPGLATSSVATSTMSLLGGRWVMH